MRLKTVEIDGKTYAEIRDGRPIYIANDGKEAPFDVAASLARIAELEKQARDEGQYIERTVLGTGLEEHLRAVGVRPELIDGAAAVLKPNLKVRRLANGDRVAIAETPFGDVDLKSFVRDWTLMGGKAYLAPPEAARTPSGKTIRRAHFDRLDPAAKMKAMTVDHLTVVD